jgi:tRNA(Glu) U13 pseudouridine synthase TruD
MTQKENQSAGKVNKCLITSVFYCSFFLELLFPNYFISNEICDKLVSDHCFRKDDVLSLESFINETVRNSTTLANRNPTLSKDTSTINPNGEVSLLPTISTKEIYHNKEEMSFSNNVCPTPQAVPPLTHPNIMTYPTTLHSDTQPSKCYIFGDSILTKSNLITGEVKEDVVYEAKKINNPSELNKLTRKAIHQAINLYFPFLYSETETINDAFKENLLCKKVRMTDNCNMGSAETKTSAKELSVTKFSVVCVRFKPCALKYLFPFCSKSKNMLNATQSNNASSQFVSLTEPTEEQKFCMCPQSNNKFTNKRKRTQRRNSKQEDSLICPICNKPQIQRTVNKNSHINRWPKDRPAYLLFHLYKVNRDTAEAIQMICRIIKCNSKVFTYAGTKDRRGITVQGVTGFHISIEQMHQALLDPQWDKNVKISNLHYTNQRLSLGHLQGNHFKICIRNVPLDQICFVDKAIEELIHNGFINFYGSQRFGTRRIRTHHIGIKLLQSDFEAGVNFILGINSPRTISVSDTSLNVTDSKTPISCLECRKVDQRLLLEHKLSADIPFIENDDVSDTSKCFESILLENNISSKNQKVFESWKDAYISGNIQLALKMLPRHLYLERTILECLLTNPGDYITALQVLPKNVITLYIHAVQSLIWNHVASYRLQTYGLQPRLGDFIAVKEEVINEADNAKTLLRNLHSINIEETENMPNDTTLYEKATTLDIPDDLHSLYEEGSDIPTINVPLENSRISSNGLKFFVVKEDTQLKYISPFDIILPFPGHGVLYPDYLEHVYIETCQKLLGIELENICVSYHSMVLVHC